MVIETYPSGRVVQNNFDTKGKLSAVSSRAAVSSPFRSFAQNFDYNEHGSVNQMQLGNMAWESTQFNNRLQPTEIALGTAPGGTQLLRLNYSYSNSTTGNNGNVLSQTITVPTIGSATGFVTTQAYTYDALNPFGDCRGKTVRDDHARLAAAVQLRSLREPFDGNGLDPDLRA